MEDDLIECPTCEGRGVISYWAGTYGTYDCKGEVEETCPDCHGEGVLDA